ncbi:MAG: class I adenylate-forming enzyme family protein [Acidimicrobiales bacterium]
MTGFRGAELAASLEVACRRWPGRPAVTFAGSTLTYRELWDRVETLARAYRRLGVVPGDRVVCQLRNCPEHVVAINAAWACGAIHVGTDNDLTGAELAWLAADTEARVLLYQPALGTADPGGVVAAVAAAAPSTTVVGHGSLGSLPAPAAESFPPSYPTGEALLLLTSGTTGRPKAVRETLAACTAKMQFFADAFTPGPEDVHLLFLPMGHVFGLRLSQLALLSGGHLVLQERFSPAEAWRLITVYRATVLPGMPTHLRLLLDAFDPDRHRAASLRWAISAASRLPSDLARRIYEVLGTELLYVYGCSENFTTLTTERDEILAGSVGHTVFAGPPGEAPDGTVRVVDPADHRPVPVGDTGEIAFGARRPVHYWRDADAATDGWYYTGDLGRLDPDGRLYVLGRLKELVDRGGLKVSPSEIETVLAAHPGVADAAVVGTPDPVLGEAICACVVPAASATVTRPLDLAPLDLAPLDLAAVREYLGVTLARHKLPDELAMVERIPRTKIGKVDRAALLAVVAAAGGAGERLRPGAGRPGVGRP